MEQCEGCYTLIKGRELGKQMELFCKIYYMLKNDFLKVCPCSYCIVTTVCKDPCKDYLDTENLFHDIELSGHLNARKRRLP